MKLRPLLPKSVLPFLSGFAEGALDKECYHSTAERVL